MLVRAAAVLCASNATRQWWEKWALQVWPLTLPSAGIAGAWALLVFLCSKGKPSQLCTASQLGVVHLVLGRLCRVLTRLALTTHHLAGSKRASTLIRRPCPRRCPPSCLSATRSQHGCGKQLGCTSSSSAAGLAWHGHTLSCGASSGSASMPVMQVCKCCLLCWLTAWYTISCW